MREDAAAHNKRLFVSRKSQWHHDLLIKYQLQEADAQLTLPLAPDPGSAPALGLGWVTIARTSSASAGRGPPPERKGTLGHVPACQRPRRLGQRCLHSRQHPPH